MYVLAAAEHGDFFLQQSVQIELRGLFGVELSEGGELVRGVGKHLYMVQQHGTHLVEALLPGRIAFCLEAHQTLDLELHGRERVLDLVGHLTGHAAPGLVALGFRQLAGTLGKVAHHTVVGCNE